MAEKEIPLKEIGIDEVRKICEKQGLKPGRVKGTKGVQFTRGSNPRVETISWKKFEAGLKARKLGVYASRPAEKGRYKGKRYLKIMKARGDSIILGGTK